MKKEILAEIAAVGVVVTVSLFVGYSLGRAREVARFTPKLLHAQEEIVALRRSASSCQGIVADHWRYNHTQVPGSEEIVTVAADLEASFSD